MTEKEVKETIKDFPVGAKLQIIKKDGEIVEVTLASNEVEAIAQKDYNDLSIPAMPAALIVQGKRWGTYRMEIDEISNIARIG